MHYYILDTLEQFKGCADDCFAAHIAIHDDQNGYTEATKRWSTPQMRLTDGKCICLVCEHYDNDPGYPIEESQPDWFPPEDEL